MTRNSAIAGRLREVFACGTAAVVTPIGEVKGEHGSFSIGTGGAGELTKALRAQLTGIQRGTEADARGWVHKVI